MQVQQRDWDRMLHPQLLEHLCNVDTACGAGPLGACNLRQLFRLLSTATYCCQKKGFLLASALERVLLLERHAADLQQHGQMLVHRLEHLQTALLSSAATGDFCDVTGLETGVHNARVMFDTHRSTWVAHMYTWNEMLAAIAKPVRPPRAHLKRPVERSSEKETAGAAAAGMASTAPWKRLLGSSHSC